MTIAIDRVSGKVLGQLLGYVSPEIDFYDGTTRPGDSQVMLLAKAGYVSVSRDSVRLEVVR